MFGLLDGLKMGGAALLAAILVAPIAHYVGKRDGLKEAQSITLEKTVELLRERKLTDELVSGMSDADLCAALGGVLNDGRCE